MKIRHLLATLALLPFAADAAYHLYVKDDTDFALRKAGPAPARQVIYDSALTAAGAYARTDPSLAPDPSGIMLVALGAGVVGLVMTRRAARERDAS